MEAKPRCYWLAQGVLGSRENCKGVNTAPCNHLFHEITEKIARSWLRKDTRTNWIERPYKGLKTMKPCSRTLPEANLPPSTKDCKENYFLRGCLQQRHAGHEAWPMTGTEQGPRPASVEPLLNVTLNVSTFLCQERACPARFQTNLDSFPKLALLIKRHNYQQCLLYMDQKPGEEGCSSKRPPLPWEGAARRAEP